MFSYNQRVKFQAESEKKPEVKKIDIPQIASELLTPNPEPTSSVTEEWKELSEGVAVRAISYPYNGSTYQLQVVRMDPEFISASLQYDQVGKQVADWAKDSSSIVVANAGFFKENNAPVGLLYINGQRMDSHRISPANTGLLQIGENGIKFLNLADTPIPEESQLQNALQTYPILIDNGQNVASKNLTSQDRRTAIGGDKSGNMYLITSQYSHLGLYDFAKILQESPLQLTEVLNLDGGGSTGVVVQAGEYKEIIDSQTAVPTVLMFTPRGS